MAWEKNGHKYVAYRFLCKELYKRGSPVKTELKNMHRIKSYGQNKIGCEILAISFVFWPIFRTKMALPEAALPMGSQSSSLYFWNQWNQENGISFSTNSKFDFCFFDPSDLKFCMRPYQAKLTTIQHNFNPTIFWEGVIYHPTTNPNLASITRSLRSTFDVA